MKPPSAARRHWPLLLAAILLVVLVGSSLLLPRDLRYAVTVVWAGITTAWAISQYAYRRVETYRLFLDRLLARIRNSSVTWGVSCEFPVQSADATWKQATEAVREAVARESDELSYEYGNAVWTFQGMTLHMKIDPVFDPVEGEGFQLRFSIPPATLALRRWQVKVEDEIVPVIRRIEESISGSLIGPPRFTVDIVFEGDNPYFGYFIARVERDTITRFDIGYSESFADEKVSVQVLSERLSFVTSSLDATRRLSLKYLALSSPGR